MNGKRHRLPDAEATLPLAKRETELQAVRGFAPRHRGFGGYFALWLIALRRFFFRLRIGFGWPVHNGSGQRSPTQVERSRLKLEVEAKAPFGIGEAGASFSSYYSGVFGKGSRSAIAIE